MIGMLHDCSHCKMPEERVFTDSWTGKELCLTCLCAVANNVTMSPATDGDNLDEELNVRVGRFCDEGIFEDTEHEEAA